MTWQAVGQQGAPAEHDNVTVSNDGGTGGHITNDHNQIGTPLDDIARGEGGGDIHRRR